jgi:hypothetical protein
VADPDPAQFWQKVTAIDSHKKVRALKLRNLREYQRYFVEVQYQDLAPADKTAAPLHLTRLQQEIDRRSHARTQWIAAASAFLALVGILMGQFQRKTRTQSTTALPSHTYIGIPAASTTPVPQSTATPEPTLVPTPSTTPTPTATEQRRGSKRPSRPKR